MRTARAVRVASSGREGASRREAKGWLSDNASSGERSSFCGWGSGRAVPLEGILELRDVTLRYWMSLHAVAGGPLILREVIRAEQPVENREVHGEIHIHGN